MRHSIVSSLLLVLFATACAQLTQPEQQVDLTVSLSRSAVAPGDTLSITVAAHNPTNRVVELPTGEGCMPLDYRIFNAEGERIAPPMGLHCAVTGGLPDGWHQLAPGESRQITHRWSAIYNYHGADAGPVQDLAPGEYHVIGGIAGKPDLRHTSAPAVLEVVAP